MKLCYRIGVSAVVSAMLWACGGGGGGGTNQNPTLTVSKVSGDSQVADADSALASPLVVIVKDDKGSAVSGQTITWSVTGGGSVTPGGATGANGQASATRTLGPNAGIQTTTAKLGSSVVGFTNISHIQGATQIALSSGNSQQDSVFATTAPLTVVVRDELNNPVANVTVNWAVTSGGGHLSGSTSLTNASGIAQIDDTLGSTPGPQSVTAGVTGLQGSPVTFATTVTAGNATVMSLVSGNNQAGPMGGALSAALVVLVKDGHGNPKSGVNLTWLNASGSISPASPVTGANGTASVTRTLGLAPGVTTDSVSVNGLAGSPVVFTDTSILVEDITIGDDFFSPQSKTLQAGGSYVRWHFNGTRSHNVTWDSGNPATLANSATQSSGTFLMRLTTSGTYGYHCSIHGSPGSGMFGTLNF